MSNILHRLTQPGAVVCNNSGPGFLLVFYFFVLACSAVFVSGSALAAPYVEPDTCGGDGQAACYISAAKNLGKVKPDGAFWDPRNGGEWWSCEGWRRTVFAVTANNACETGSWPFSLKSKSAKLISSEKSITSTGAFKDIGRQEWWRCPAGFTRNANPVHKGEACSATIGKACDSGLVDIRDPSQKGGGGFTCYKKGECGADGQRVCTILADGKLRAPCNKGLEEDILTVRCRIGAFGDVGDLDKDFDKFYKDTWEGRAIIDQVALSLDVPLSKATMIGTHNSFNSKSYNYIDPNQYLTLLDQLKGGAHFIELDVHDRDNKDIVLCHSKHEKGKPGGCGGADLKLSAGLDEIKTFLKDSKYKNRIFILYLENYSKKPGEIYNVIQQKIGQYVYKSGGCKMPIPADALTARDILNAGKRVLIWNGSEIEKECSDHQNFRNMVFTNLGSIKRIWEDETSASAFGGSGTQWTPTDVVKEIEAGKNLATHDFLYINDVYKAMAWSWNTNEPNNHAGNEHCAAQAGFARLGKGHVWNDSPCSKNDLAYACQDIRGEWKVTTKTGAWSQGEAECKKLGSHYMFSVPTTAEENLKLTKKKPAGKSVWLNYTDQVQEGKWVAKHYWNSPLQLAPLQLGGHQAPFQKWGFLSQQQIYNGKSTRCLDVASDTNGGAVVIASCGDATARPYQVWSLESGGQVKNKRSTRCLDVASTTGSAVITDCDAARSSQVWSLKGTHLYNPESGKCLDVRSNTDGGAVGIFDCGQAG